MGVINIKKIIDNQTLLAATPANRRDFRLPVFMFKGNQVGSSRVRYWTGLQDIITAYGSNSEVVKAASAFFSGGFNGIKPIALMVGNVASGDTWSDVLGELIDDPRYYYIAVDNTFTEQENKDMAAVLEASTKIKYLGAVLTRDSNVADLDLAADTTSIAKVFYNAKYRKTFIEYDDETLKDDYKHMASLSYFATVNFTSARKLGTLAFKQFAGQTPTPFTDADEAFDNITSKNCNLYAAYGEVGRNIAYKGVVPEGSQIRTIIGADWLDYNITYNIFDLLVAVHQIGYNTGDFTLLEGAIAKACEQAKAFDLIKPGTDKSTGKEYPIGYDIQIPNPDDVSSSDQALGILTGTVIECLINGAVVKIDLTTVLKF